MSRTSARRTGSRARRPVTARSCEGRYCCRY
jgi:hypothetical protein